MISLSDRERKLLRILYIIAGLFLLYFLVISPVITLRRESRESWSRNQKRIEDMDALYSEYRDIAVKKDRINEIMRDSRGVATLIEETAKSANILQNKAYNKDATSNIQNKYTRITTEVRFEGVDIRPMMKFLYDMEHGGKYIRITYLRITQAVKERQTYDVTIKFESYQIQ